MSRIQSDLDFSAQGKQTGFLRVPCPRNSSAWGVLMIPVVLIRNGEGPSVLLTAGQHGDEYEGPLALGELMRTLQAEQIQGEIMILPALNLPALQISTRLSPLDGKDMNRAFPGDPNGSPTQMLADYISRVLLPRADLVLDMHSGGQSLDFLPSVIMHRVPDARQYTATRSAFEAFGAPYGMVLAELDAVGMFDTYVEQQGKIFLSTELSGAGQVSREALAIAIAGVQRLLQHLGLLREPIVPPARGLWFCFYPC
ncbi:MAG: succinylglutamate desuccinylase/aspartoacylase family protein [Candidatus Sericytochromatia bacterium]|nr:succinylglutamate desuccinylase/aspartoacylase family protein [Candidatus Sericytochromatia bacterium]